MKIDDDMKRIVAIAAAFAAMFAIIGISIHSINSIDKVNQRKREEEKGKNFAATIAQTTATTNIWEYLRSSTEPLTETLPEETVVEGEDMGDGYFDNQEEISEAGSGADISEQTPAEQALPEHSQPEQTPFEQTVTTTMPTPAVVYID